MSQEYEPVDGCLRSLGGGIYLYLYHDGYPQRRGDGAILYGKRYWGTTSPPEGWVLYAYYQVKDQWDYEQVSEERPLSEYI